MINVLVPRSPFDSSITFFVYFQFPSSSSSSSSSSSFSSSSSSSSENRLVVGIPGCAAPLVGVGVASNNIELEIINVGAGTATDVRVFYSVPILNIAEQMRPFASMPSRYTGSLNIPAEEAQQQGQDVQVLLRYEYKDILGKKHNRNEDLTVRLHRPF